MTRHASRTLLTLIALTGFAAVGMGGCYSDGGENPALPDRPRYEPPPDGAYRDPDDAYYDRNNQTSPKKRADGIPSSARLMEEGRILISFTASRDGRVYVENTHDLVLLLETQLYEGEKVTVDAKADVIAIDDKTIPPTTGTRKLVNDHRYRIYFYADPSSTPKSGDKERVKDRDTKY